MLAEKEAAQGKQVEADKTTGFGIAMQPAPLKGEIKQSLGLGDRKGSRLGKERRRPRKVLTTHRAPREADRQGKVYGLFRPQCVGEIFSLK